MRERAVPSPATGSEFPGCHPLPARSTPAGAPLLRNDPSAVPLAGDGWGDSLPELSRSLQPLDDEMESRILPRSEKHEDQ